MSSLDNLEVSLVWSARSVVLITLVIFLSITVLLLLTSLLIPNTADRIKIFVAFIFNQPKLAFHIILNAPGDFSDRLSILILRKLSQDQLDFLKLDDRTCKQFERTFEVVADANGGPRSRASRQLELINSRRKFYTMFGVHLYSRRKVQEEVSEAFRGKERTGAGTPLKPRGQSLLGTSSKQNLSKEN